MWGMFPKCVFLCQFLTQLGVFHKHSIKTSFKTSVLPTYYSIKRTNTMVKWRVDHLSPTLSLLTPHLFPCFYIYLLYGTPFHLLSSSTFIVLFLLHASFSHLSTHTLWNLCCSLCLFSPHTWQPSPQPVATVTRQGGREGKKRARKLRERETLRGTRDAVCVRVEKGRERWEMWHWCHSVGSFSLFRLNNRDS